MQEARRELSTEELTKALAARLSDAMRRNASEKQELEHLHKTLVDGFEKYRDLGW